MRRDVRKKLDMAVRVRDFGRTHPTEGPGERLLGTIDDLLTRAAALRDQQSAGRDEEAATALRRQELRRTIQGQLLPHVVRVGELAADLPGLAGKFHLRSADATHTAFLASARAMLSLGETNKEAFLARGLAESLLPELGERLTEFDANMQQSRAARVAHVHAREQRIKPEPPPDAGLAPAA